MIINDFVSVEGYGGDYKINKEGIVISFKRYKDGKILKPGINKFGYKHVSFSDGMGNCKSYRVHRLVAKAFIPNPKNKLCINHINGNKLDNRVENLEWCTHSENLYHAYANGLKEGPVGIKHGKCKLTEKQVLEIKSLRGKLTQKDISKIYGVSRSNISSILNKHSWTHL